MTTFSVTDKTSNITLSNSNLTATDANTSNAGVRGTTSKSTGKWMLQFTSVTLVDSLDYIGVGTASDTLGLAQGSQVQVIKVLTGTTFSGDGVGGTNALTGTAIPAGATVDLCLDLTGLKSWWRINGGNWNGSPTNDPATGVGGNVIGKSDTYLPYIRLTGTSATATLNPSPAGVPSGFTSWDGVVSPSGTWASTEAADIFHVVGRIGPPGPSGSLATTEIADTFAAVGFVASVGPWASTEAVDIFSAFLRLPVTGTWHSTETTDRFNAAGLGRGENGVFITSEAIDIFAAIGHTPLAGPLHAIETPDRFLALGPGVHANQQRRIFFVT